MRTTVAALVLAVTCTTGAALLGAQDDPPAVNPLAGNADAIQSGMGIFRSRCADCHGLRCFCFVWRMCCQGFLAVRPGKTRTLPRLA